MEVNGQLLAQAPLPPGKEHSLDRRLGVPQSRSGRGDEPPGIEP
jgi:hypothetical protein